MPKPTAGMLKISLALKRWFLTWGSHGVPTGQPDAYVLKVFTAAIRANAANRYEDNSSIPNDIKTVSLARLSMHWSTAHKELKAALRQAGYVLDMKDTETTKTESLKAFPDVPEVWVWDIISLLVDLKKFGPIRVGNDQFRPAQTLTTCLKWIARLDAGDASSSR